MLGPPPATHPVPPPFAYHAFISYSHAQDRLIADALQREVRRFGVPWYGHRTAPLVGPPGSRGPLRIFRDVTDLSATPALWPGVLAALSASQWLILMASPAAAQSGWVRQEVTWWLANRPADRILIALTDGQLAWRDGDFDWDATDAIPQELAGTFTHEPRWIDLRPLRPGTPESVSPPDAARPGDVPRRAPLRLGDIVADFAAPIRGLDKDSLVGEHVRQRRRVRRTVRAVVGALTVLALAATSAAVVAFRQRAIAIEQRDTALANQLVAEADTVRDSQPGLARQLIAAARDIKLTPLVAGALVGGAEIAQELHVDADLLAYRSDGQALAVVRSGNIENKSAFKTVPARDGHLALYDTQNLAVLAEQKLGQLPIGALAFGPAPGHLFGLGYGRDVRLWDVSDPRSPAERGTLVGHSATVLSVVFSPDGRTVATADRAGEIRLWDVTNADQPILLSRIPLDLRIARYTMAFHPGGRTLAVAPIPLRQTNPPVPEAVAVAISDGPTLMMLFDVTDPRRWDLKLGTVGKIRSFVFSPDGAQLLTIGPDGPRTWAVDGAGKASGAQPLPVSDPDATLAVAASGAGGRTAAVAEDGAVLLWEAGGRSPALTARLGIPRWDSRNPQGLTFSPDGRRVALLTPGSNAGATGAGVGSGTLRIWTIPDGRQRGAVGAVPGRPTLSPDGSLLAAADGKTIRLWDVTDLAQPRQVGTVTGPDRPDGLLFSPDGRMLAAHQDSAVWAMDVSDPRTPRVSGRWTVPDNRNLCGQLYPELPCDIGTTALAFPDDRTLAVGDVAGQVSLFDLTRGGSDPVAVLKTYGFVADLAMLPASDRPLLVVGMLAGVTEIWDLSDVNNAENLGRLPGGRYQVQDLSVSRDGAVLAIARRDGTAWLWRVREHGRALRRIATLTDTGDVNAVAVSPDGGRLATLGRDRTLRVYRLKADSAELAMVRHLGVTADTDLAFADHHTLAVGTEYGQTTFWELDPDTGTRAICVGIGTPITEDQWKRDVPGLPYRPPCR
ncbi:TIR domain-containing protein [Micromonospora thermarum]|nr:TIR domain-containing protein [Micromonospora thermarum]